MDTYLQQRPALDDSLFYFFMDSFLCSALDVTRLEIVLFCNRVKGHTHTHTHTYIHKRKHTHTYAHTHTGAHARTHTHKSTTIHKVVAFSAHDATHLEIVLFCKRVRGAHTNSKTHTHTHTHTHTPTHTHTHTHTHTPRFIKTLYLMILM